MVVQLVFFDTDEFVFPASVRTLTAELLADIEPVVREQLPMLAGHLNLSVYPGRRVIPETGHGGFTPTKDWIQMTVDPADPRGVESILRAQMRSCFAHEAHHAARYVAGGPNVFDHRVVSVAVFEGLATVFESEVTGIIPPWGTYDETLIDDWLDELVALPPDLDSRPWRFAHPDGRRWVAYRAGSRLVQRAVAATGQTAAELVGASTDELLEAAGFKPAR
jgi:uncharacterized protein YjaZ